jgi:hypothetical protein
VPALPITWVPRTDATGAVYYGFSKSSCKSAGGSRRARAIVEIAAL